MQQPDVIVPWLAINTTGQWCLIFLLITYACARWLPQRNNAYLINFMLVVVLSCIPPALLFYTGHLFSDRPSGLCLAQASLVVGAPTMFAVAELALAFDAWSELRSLCTHKVHVSRITFVKCIALIAPYFTMGFWTFADFQASVSDPKWGAGTQTPYYGNDTVHSNMNVFCVSPGVLPDKVMAASGIFMVVVTTAQVFLQVWVAWMIYAYPSKVQDDPTAWRTSIQFSLRIMILSLLQLVTEFMTVINGAVDNANIKYAYQLLVSMNSLAAFLAVGVQSNVLQTWKYAALRVWDFITRKKPENPDELQPQGQPGLDWAFVPKKFEYTDSEAQSTSVGQDLETEERGLSGRKFIPHTWTKYMSRLRVG
ncbi:hypothetical protein JB92DRAFT_3133564 [Gautieria morchelliformis]|nr:hypothetical protein JB92DRAFT_3133564 [Gautieria morchelliformis]